MSDNVQRYHAVRNQLRTMHPDASTSKRLARHLGTLGGMVAGIVAAGQVHLPKLALKAPDATKAQSRTKRFARFLRNEATEFATFYEPFARMVASDCSASDCSASDCSASDCLTDGRSHETPLLIVFDSSAVGRGCAVLMASVVYQQGAQRRALPLAWIVRKGKKGHFSSADQRALLRRVQQIIPEDSRAIFLGDGEFDSVALQQALDEIGFDYVCRTAYSTLVEDHRGEVFPIGELSPFEGERYVVVPGASVTGQGYGPVQVVCWHEPPHEDPVPLVTTLECAEEAIRLYQQRFQIETLFSDQKSRGFHIHKSHIAAPKRLSRLLMAVSLAYLWVIYLGTQSLHHGWYRQFHRTSRVDLSLFQLGLRLLDYMLNQGWPVDVAFSVPPPGSLQTVR